MKTESLIQAINNDLAIELPEKISLEELQLLLADHINHLIKTKFETLVSLLYRIDVDEEKLKYHLIDNPGEDAGTIISSLIIERQQQKIEFRNKFSAEDNNFNGEEKW